LKAKDYINNYVVPTIKILNKKVPFSKSLNVSIISYFSFNVASILHGVTIMNFLV